MANLIESLIQDVVGSSPDLVALLPLDRWVTGTGHFDDEAAYCTINLEGGSPSLRTNTFRVNAETIRFQVYSNDHSEGRDIQEELLDLLDDLSYNFETSDGSTQVIYARVQNKFGIQEPSLVWQFLTDVIFWSN